VKVVSSVSEGLFPRSVEVHHHDYDAQRDLAHWTISELELTQPQIEPDMLVHPDQGEIQALVEQAHAAIDAMNRSGVESGVLSPEL
jgi:hypothetical protein